MSDIVVGSAAVDIVPTTRNFRRDLNAKLQGITVDVGVNADTTGVRAQLDDLTRSRDTTINVNADVGSAEARLDETARDRTSKIRASVESNGLTEAISGFGALTTAAITLGPALIPIAATLGAIGLALGAPLAIAAGGATVFGFIAGAAIKQTEAQKKKIDELAKAVTAAKLSLANANASASASAANSLASARASAAASLSSARQALANATTSAQRRAAQQRIDAAQTAFSARQAAIQRSQSASVASAQRRVTEAVSAYQAAVKGLTPQQQKFLDAQTKLKASFQNLLSTSGPAILGPVTQAINTLTGILPKLSPILDATSGALKTLLTELGNAVNGPDFKKFIAAFSQQITPDIVAFGRIAGNVFKGVAGLVIGLGRAFGTGILNNLVTLTGKFAEFGQTADKSKALRDFVDYFHRIGPQVGDTIGAIARAVGHVVKALAPLGPPVLKIVEGIANSISAIPIPVLTALATAFVSMVAAAKISKGLSALGLLEGGGGLGKSGGVLGQFTKAAKPVPVFVTNPGFGAGGGGAGGVLAGAGGKAATLEGEAAAIAAAKAAAEGVRAAGGGAAAESQAAARAFKEAMAAHDAAVLKEALSFGVKGGLRGLLGTILAAPAGITLGAAGHETRSGTQINGPVGSESDFLKLVGSQNLQSVATRADALRTSLGKASQVIDQIGPKADAAFGQAARDVDRLAAKIAALHGKTIQIRIEQEIDRVTGPGGGIHRPTGASAGGAAASNFDTPSASRAAGASAPLVNIERATVSDVNDLLRKSADAVRARAGGGVILRPQPTASFG